MKKTKAEPLARCIERLDVRVRARLERDLAAGYTAAALSSRFGLSSTSIAVFAKTCGIRLDRPVIARGESFCVDPDLL